MKKDKADHMKHANSYQSKLDIIQWNFSLVFAVWSHVIVSDSKLNFPKK